MLFTLVVPVALFGAIGADFVIAAIFGHHFAPAAAAFRVLCPVIVLVYMAILPALMLTRLERGWTVTGISIGIMAMNLTLNWFAIPAGVRVWGAGGGGIGAATAWLICEAVNVVLLYSLAADRMFDARNVRVIAKTVAAGAVVWLVYLFLPPTLVSVALLAILYVALVVGAGAVQVAEVTRFAKLTLRRPTPQTS
jgi:O-antigen/teichoic acid export membrane protein